MEIIKEGDPKTRRFECQKCKTEFKADIYEYQVLKFNKYDRDDKTRFFASTNANITPSVKYVCRCPKCKAECIDGPYKIGDAYRGYQSNGF